MWKSIITKKRLLNEAPNNENDFQLSQEDLGQNDGAEDSNDFQLNEVPGDDPANGQTAEDPNAMGEDPNAMGGGDPMMGGQDPSMMGDDPMPPEETETDRLKKLTLLEKYKQLLELIEQANFTLSCLDKIDSFDEKNENIIYIKKILEKTENKIKDVIAYRFLNEDYKELLRLFYYFKYTIIHITKLLDDTTSIEKYNNIKKSSRRKITRNK